ncbi:MAG: hypothetical protein RQ754_13590 [Desulfuromonadales bacterium]|nr:hypothetical protein [Desulfuromonadales bacterium]
MLKRDNHHQRDRGSFRKVFAKGQDTQLPDIRTKDPSEGPFSPTREQAQLICKPGPASVRMLIAEAVLLAAHAAVQFCFTPAITAAADVRVSAAAQPSAPTDQTDGQPAEGEQE